MLNIVDSGTFVSLTFKVPLCTHAIRLPASIRDCRLDQPRSHVAFHRSLEVKRADTMLLWIPYCFPSGDIQGVPCGEPADREWGVYSSTLADSVLQAESTRGRPRIEWSFLKLNCLCLDS